jgi:hypothetical protein
LPQWLVAPGICSKKFESLIINISVYLQLA